MRRRRGIEENVPYSLSRWTDVPGSQNKWDWFKRVLTEGEMIAFDSREVIPALWSLKPEDTLGLNFWTKDPRNLLIDRELLKPYRVQIHMTITGWEEVEKGAPSMKDAIWMFQDCVSVFGAENVIWRFSPVPLVNDVIQRFHKIANHIRTPKVYVAFLQPNDLVPETRDAAERRRLLNDFARCVDGLGTQVLLCNDDKALFGVPPPYNLPPNLALGVCAGPEAWAGKPATMGCGCAHMVNPFSINESCTFGCTYCLEPSTPVLYSDMVWRPIGEAQVGDRLVGFDEFPTGRGRGSRKMRETIIEAIRVSQQPTIRLITNQSDVFTTANHGWINRSW